MSFSRIALVSRSSRAQQLAFSFPKFTAHALSRGYLVPVTQESISSSSAQVPVEQTFMRTGTGVARSEAPVIAKAFLIAGGFPPITAGTLRPTPAE